MTPKRLMRTAIAVVCCLTAVVAAQELVLPTQPNSVKFAVFGDNGTGDTPQVDIARQLLSYHEKFPFNFVIMLGDNIYGSQDFSKKFEQPYKALLDAKVMFYAALGNHDDQNEKLYKPFNMGGKQYYTFKTNSVRFFALDSNYMDKAQLDWLEKELAASGSDWKIASFHHPLYSTGKTHGSSLDLRKLLEPLFVKYDVSVVFAGHEHFYERLKPQQGIQYFISGAGGQLRSGDINRTEPMAVGFDQDQSFMLVEIVGKELFFQAITRGGKTVDRGTITQLEAHKVVASPVVTSTQAAPPPAQPTAVP
jgi:predicted phosphodiesterase